MSEQAAQPSTPPRPSDFDAVYRGDFAALAHPGQESGAAESGGAPPEFLLDRVPWDIGEAQPVVRKLEASGQFSGDVLDIGCGPGENTLMLAAGGHHTVGLDASPAAIEIARGRAGTRGLAKSVEFAVADAFELSGYAGRFDTVIDSALYHCFPEELRQNYTASVHRACRTGARLHLLCFSDRVPEAFPGPYRITEANLRENLAATGWSIQNVRPATYTTAFTRSEFEGRAPAPLVAAIAALESDGQGRLLAPAWLVTAERV
ncbi:methyltransferase domain-containing protein [Rhodococcus sp. D2-41]|uniref:class I SAM-dependent methyltransferase n=1 Tax=Speluncibacter jeojiensis TaxID=2710754 RepID=UPI00240EFE8C|nr:class I SAM-dependent methyltransferase [Rhodococcus sp. D2-41]MDG3012283.1 methyltransferase domain-containing protein [Rhodococcus sp. D2-41]